MESGEISQKSYRTDYLNWDDYFMAMAVLVSKRSKDPVTQVGACIVNENKRIVGTGYNGMPNGCNDDEFVWSKGDREKLERKSLFACHAEMNAIVNKNAADIRDCTVYVSLFPCNECAKLIIQSGIKKIVYLSDKYYYKAKTKASKKMLNAVGIKYEKFKPIKKKIEIDLEEHIENVAGKTECPPAKKFKK